MISLRPVGRPSHSMNRPLQTSIVARRRPAAAALVVVAAITLIGLKILSANAISQPKQAPVPVVLPAPVAVDVSAADGHLRLHPGFDPTLPCTCDSDRLRNGWCWHCNVGYIGGLKINNALLFETLDPHGHDLDPTSLQFESCQDVIKNDGYCEPCGIGFVRGKAFFTRLTFGLAMGSVVTSADSLACKICASHLTGCGWCDQCHRGIVGNVAFTNKAMFDRTAAEFATLKTALEKTSTCELCACAMVVHRTCPKCGTSYSAAIPH
jgi:hypothetical protein